MKLLVAIDGSSEAEDALEYASGIADAVGGSITVAHVVDPAVYETGGSEPVTTFADAESRLITQDVGDAEDRGQRFLDHAAEFAKGLGHDVETELLYGDPVTEISDYAEDEGFDTVFVGHRGRSARADLLLGSVAKELVERATVPVTVVR
jgi:nucleotide-binding universal stress UspA family protein